MGLAERIDKDLKEAMVSRDSVRTSSLRMLKSALKLVQVEKRRPLSEEEIQTCVSSLVRKGRDAAAEYRQADREDLAQKEEREIEIFLQYLPQQLTAAEIEQAVREVIAELQAAGPKDMGRVMKAAMQKVAGRAQGKEVNAIARKLLA